MPPNHWERRRFVAAWWCRKYRLIAEQDGVQLAARRLRKQGVPVEVTLRVLGIQPSLVQAPAEPTGTTAGRTRSFRGDPTQPGEGVRL